MQNPIIVEVVVVGGAKEVRLFTSQEPPEDDQAGQLEVRRGGSGVALRFRDPEDFDIFAEAIGAA